MSDPSGAPGPWHDQFREVAARLSQPGDQLLALLGDLVERSLPAVRAAGCSLLTPADDKHLHYLISRGHDADRLADLQVPLEGSIAGYVFSTGTSMAFGDLDGTPPAAVEVDVGGRIETPRIYLALPILKGGRAHGVATFRNRSGPPPHRPFEQSAIEWARQHTVLQGAVLRHLERIWQLERFGAYDLAVAWAALDPSGSEPLPRKTEMNCHLEPWARMLQHLERLSQEDQDFCTDLVSFVARRRNWELG